MGNNKLKELAQDFCNKYSWANVDDLYNFLIDHQWRIYYDRVTQMLRDSIEQELDELSFDVEKIPNSLLKQMEYDLEGQFHDEQHLRDCLNTTIEWFKKDLEEYKLEEKE